MSILRDIDDIFRAGAPAPVADAALGLLVDLPGRWVGHGFNLIARPARQGIPTNPPFILEINATVETLEFDPVVDIANRGDVEPTIIYQGLRYLQQVTDCEDNSGIHVEPGLWLHFPPSTSNKDDVYFRQANIPHGDSLIAQSSVAISVSGGPKIDPVDTFPIKLTQPIPGLNDITHQVLGAPYTDPYTTTPLPENCLPKGLDAAKVIRDPTEVLRAQIAGQNIEETVVLVISTSGNPPNISTGILNIPFVGKNANATQMDAIFWIEKVHHPKFNRQFMQLQYVQRVILDFDDIHWPHVSVATLVKNH